MIEERLHQPETDAPPTPRGIRHDVEHEGVARSVRQGAGGRDHATGRVPGDDPDRRAELRGDDPLARLALVPVGRHEEVRRLLRQRGGGCGVDVDDRAAVGFEGAYVFEEEVHARIVAPHRSSRMVRLRDFR